MKLTGYGKFVAVILAGTALNILYYWQQSRPADAVLLAAAAVAIVTLVPWYRGTHDVYRGDSA